MPRKPNRNTQSQLDSQVDLAPQTITRHIKSVADLISFLSIDVQIPNDSERRFYYRGTPDQSYRLLPRLLRPDTFEKLEECYHTNDPVELQAKLIQRFKRYAAQFDKHHLSSIKRDVEWIAVAQHHGLPTLMLDWTLNPLIALYFAAAGTSDESSKDGAVWCMPLQQKNTRQGNTIYLGDNASDVLFDQSHGPYIVVPLAYTPRIYAQAGRFVYNKLKKPLDDLSDAPPWQPLQKWIVANEHKSLIINELRHFQIHEGTVFADIDGYAKYLGSGGL